MTTLRLPASYRDAIVQHAREEAPRECCGIISGRTGTLTRHYRMTNTDPGTRLYVMDDEELFRTLKEIDKREEDPLVIYHSHPETEAYPSRTDVELAFWEDSFYVICSLKDPDSPSVRAFRIVGGGIEEAEIHTTD
jgi:[CysO sulfur-carrier protein]-S-L-cysteine hydrolase